MYYLVHCLFKAFRSFSRNLAIRQLQNTEMQLGLPIHAQEELLQFTLIRNFT